MSLSVSSNNIITLQNTVVRPNITVEDVDDNILDPSSLTATLMDIGGNVIMTDTWPSPATRIVRAAVGQFYLDLGNQTPNNETSVPCELLLDWQVTLVSNGQVSHTLQKIKVIPPRLASILPEFRLMIDKTQKIVDVSQNCFLGYTDAQLISYLEGGLANINSYQPSVNFSVNDFPLMFKQLWLDSGLITGVMSQQLFAIDTDIPNYNDQGTSFVISHQPQLASFLNQVTQRLDKMIPQMKLQFINSGALHTTMGPNYRLNVLMESAPSGAIFRNVFFVP